MVVHFGNYVEEPECSKDFSLEDKGRDRRKLTERVWSLRARYWVSIRYQGAAITKLQEEGMELGRKLRRSVVVVVGVWTREEFQTGEGLVGIACWWTQVSSETLRTGS